MKKLNQNKITHFFLFSVIILLLLSGCKHGSKYSYESDFYGDFYGSEEYRNSLDTSHTQQSMQMYAEDAVQSEREYRRDEGRQGLTSPPR